MFKRIVTAAMVFGMAALAPPSNAQTACAKRSEIVHMLENAFAEKLSALGLRSELQLMEIWSSDAKGTWTILLTKADGTSCIVASGTDWVSNFDKGSIAESPLF